MRKRSVWAWGIAIVCFIVLMIVTPAIPQSQEYHNFADQRKFLGLVLCHHGNYFKLSLQGELWGWTCFYIGVAAVAFGSAYYHLKPNDARLVWDRLPMTVAFTSIIGIFIIERIDERKGTVSLIPLILAGVVSIMYWSAICTVLSHPTHGYFATSDVHTFHLLAVGCRILSFSED
ncbi:hypothetical protein AABB24_002095 [Solanum stoloniferum]|uniref:Post-GPI attachment to proteins factor 3 n=1 Tax=Solanum stoloniferum TaxID=62892 RepID=A0ABD2VN12_9SOLN